MKKENLFIAVKLIVIVVGVIALGYFVLNVDNLFNDLGAVKTIWAFFLPSILVVHSFSGFWEE